MFKRSLHQVWHFIVVGVLVTALLLSANPAAAAPIVIATITVGTNPNGVGVNPNTNRVYITNISSNTVSVIDSGSNTVIATVAVGTNPNSVGVNSNTNHVYVTNYNSNSVTVIDGGSSTVIATVGVGFQPVGVGVNPSTNRVYVANQGSNSVSVIDDGSSTVITTVTVGSQPYGVGVNPSTNRVYVANQVDNTVSVIDGSSNTVIATISVGSQPYGVGVNPTTNRIYVVNGGSNSVTVIDGTNNTVIGSPIPVGSFPVGVGVNPTTNRVYVANNSSNSMSVIDGGSNTVIGGSISVGANPSGVGVNPTTNRIYVANNSSNNVSVITDTPLSPTASQLPGVSGLVVGQSTSLTITLANPQYGYGTLSNLAFSEILPTGLVVTGSPATTCGGTIATPPGGIVFSGGTLNGAAALSTTCTVSVSVQANGVAIGPLTLPAFTVSSDQLSFTASLGFVTVDKANTTAAVSPSSASVVGQSVTFSATVSVTVPGAGTPTGTVTFRDGSTTLGTGVLSGGAATFSTSSLSVGGHTISAIYNGDGDFNGSTASGQAQPVNPATTTTAVSSSGSPTVVGQAVTFLAAVSITAPGAGLPTGTVMFKDGSTTLGTTALSSNAAVFSTSSLTLGGHSITAVYSGDANFTTSTSSVQSQTVNPATTTAANSSSNSTAVVGQNVTFLASVSVTAPGTGFPTGTVAFKDGSTTLGSGMLLGNLALFGTSSLTVGSHSITAVYSGDSNFTTSTSLPLTQNITSLASTVADGFGLFNPTGGQFYLKNTPSAGTQDLLFAYGPAPSTLIPVSGDWLGQGFSTVGLYNPTTGMFYLHTSNAPGNAEIAFQFGPTGANLIPLVGDWTGKGFKSVGVYNPTNGTFYLRSSNTAGTANFQFQYGPTNSTLLPIVGDWTNQGYDTIGLYNGAQAYFYLHNCQATTCSAADNVFQFGPATSLGGAAALLMIGHWVGGGAATIGIYVPANAYFYLKNTNAAGNADEQFQFGPGPNAGWLPVVGHWGTSTPPSVPTPTPARIIGSLGFTSNRDGQWRLYRLTGDEKHLQPLAVIGKNLIQSRPAWSPDGQRIAFVADGDGSPALYVMNADGSSRKRLTWNAGLSYQPSWSPDSKQLVFASNLGNSTNLYLMEVANGSVRQLTHSVSDLNEQPTWSPDGTQIVYATGKGTLDIAVIAMDGKRGTLLAKNGRQPVWSPDGMRIAFASTRDGNSQLYVMNADDSNVQRLTNDKAQDEMPTWSPDGKQIAFVSTRDGNAHLYVMSADGSNVQRLTNSTGQDQLPAWLP